MFNRWQIVAVVNIIAAYALIIMLSQSIGSTSFDEHQIFNTACQLAIVLMLLVLPATGLQQKTLNTSGKIWCVLAGPVWFFCSLILWWILVKIAGLGNTALEIVHLLYPAALLMNIILLIRYQIKMSRQKAISDHEINSSYDRQQCKLDADRFLGLKKYQNAIDACTIALDKDPNDAEMYALRAVVYEKMELNDLAKKDKDLSTKFGYKPEPPKL